METANPLMKSLNEDDVGERKAKKADMWFQKIGDLEDDSDLEETEIGRAVDIVQKKGGTIKKRKAETMESTSGYNSDSEDDDEGDEVGNRHHENTLISSDSESDEDEKEVEHVSASGKVYNKDGFEIVPQQKVKRRDIEENGWHRFMFNDENLPDWFVK